MATNTDRLDNLERQVAGLTVQEKVFGRDLAHLESALQALRDETAKLKAENDSLRAAFTESEKRNAILEATVRELKAASERLGLRVWQLVAGVILAVVGGVIGYLLKR